MKESTVIRSLWVLVVAGFIVGSQCAIASSSDAGTLTVGIGSGGLCGGLPLIDTGYLPALSKGAYSPTTLTGGRTVGGVIDYDACTTESELDVEGFSSNPGASWLISISCNGVTNDGSTATFAYYSGGSGVWQWSHNFGFLSLGNGAQVSCTIVHN